MLADEKGPQQGDQGSYIHLWYRYILITPQFLGPPTNQRSMIFIKPKLTFCLIFIYFMLYINLFFKSPSKFIKKIGELYLLTN